MNRKKIIIITLISVYVLLAVALGIARLTTRPAGDTTSPIALVASGIIYLACSLGIAWLLELLLQQWVPANHLVKQRAVHVRHLRRKEKGMLCGRQHYRQKLEEQQENEILRKRLSAAYQLGYQKGQANNHHRV